MIQNMLDALFPAKLAELCKKMKGGVGEGVKYIVAGGFVALVFAILRILLAGVISGTSGLSVAASIAAVIGWLVMLIPTIIITYLIVWIASMLIGALLGGKAAFPQLFLMFAVYGAGIQVLTGVLGLIVGIIAALSAGIGALLLMAVSLLVGLYGLYLAFVVLKSIYGFETMKAVLSLIVYLVVLLVVWFVIAMVLAVVFVMLGLGAYLTAGTVGTAGLTG